ncbi:hypothetical protein CDA63_00100 [Hymenobacter amundsenii]|uniref:Outer membrane protein beta-barrel domain-containing protein n=1 Tax=Hymenobacter amundsenii TaxID=2006685 RepID=A0A246FQ10_9BACT|nr:hypothetical protein [Hymenobacter amundsenii]OWP64800.1 hypothetical protein CDA63_00100 [Hymenobacter amundsenii]
MRILLPGATALLLLLAENAAAQDRSTSNVVLLPEVQAEIALPGNDYVLVGVNAFSQTNRGGSTFAGGQLRVGYEHFWNEHWSWGPTLRIGSDAGGGYGDFLGVVGNLTPGVLLRHAGPIGSFRFSQRLATEYAASTNDSFSNNGNRAHARLRLGLDREFGFGPRLKLRPRLSYEALAYLRFQREANQNKERFIDFGSARAEVGVRLSPRIDFTPWVALQTQYINALPQFDQNGNPVSGGRTNLRTPVLGLDLRFLLGKNALSSDRIILPTQH